MELLITGKNMELTATLRQLIERKLGKLSRRLPNIKEQKVEIYQEKTKSPEQHFVVEVTLDPRGVVLVEGERWTATLDKGRAEPEEEVTITKVDGLKLYVTRKK